MRKRAISTTHWSAARALALLAEVANGAVDPVALWQSLPNFLAADDGGRDWPISPLLQLEYDFPTLPKDDGQKRDERRDLHEALTTWLRWVGPLGNAGGGFSLGPIHFFAATHGMLVGGPLQALAQHQAIRLFNRHPDALRRCPAFAAGSGRTRRCGRWFVARAARQGPIGKYCSPECGKREWRFRHCTNCGKQIGARADDTRPYRDDRCKWCGRSRVRRPGALEAPAALQRTATGGTGGIKKAQPPKAVRKKARQSPRGKGGR